MKRWSLITAVSGFIITLLLTPSTPAQQQASPPQKPLQHEVAVTLKLIQVYVTDKDGKPVLDLIKDDFIVTDDGKAQILTEFEKHVLSLPSPEAPAEEKLAATPLPAASNRLNRKIFFFFNFGYSSAQGIRQAREEALKFFATSTFPSDEVAVLTYSLFDRLKVREFLTADPVKARKAIEAIGVADALGVVEDPADRVTRLLSDSRTPAIKGLEDMARMQARTYIAHLTSLAQSLRYMPGQKILVMFTMGIDGKILYRGDPLGDQFADIRNGYENLCSELATSNIAVYSIDTTDKGDPEYLCPENLRGISSLRRMAQVTGGEFMGHVDASEAHFKKLQTLTGYYYVLGYSIDERWDGQYHKIKVSVRRPGCEVHTQAGYFNPKSFPDYTAVEKRMHLVDLALSEKPLGQVPVRFPMTAQAFAPAKEDGLCLAAEIPVAKIREQAGKKAEISCLVFDDRDEVVSEQRSEEDFTSFSGETAYVFSRASAPPGRYRCRIVVRNLETGAAAVAAATTIVPLKKEKGVQIYPPLFLKPDRGGHYLRGLLPKASSGRTTADMIAETFLFDPAQYVPQTDKTLKRGSEAWASVHCATGSGQAGEIKLSAFLYDKQTRNQVPVPLTIIAKKDGAGLKSYFVNFKIPEVEPDEYRFCFVAEDPATGEISMEVADFIIE